MTDGVILITLLWRSKFCSRNIELLAVSMRLYHLHREFLHVIAVTAYVPPSANPEKTCDTLLSVVRRLQTQSAQALFLISGDFKHASLDSILPTFMWHAPLEAIKHWTYYMPTLKVHTVYHLCLPWEDLITIWSTWFLCMSPLGAGCQHKTRTVQRWSEEL